MSNPLRRLVLLVVCSCAVGALGACSSVKATTQPTESLTVRELTIVDEHGQPRVRIGAPLPDPKGLKREVKPVGIQLMEPNGKESGGLVMIDNPCSTTPRAIRTCGSRSTRTARPGSKG